FDSKIGLTICSPHWSERFEAVGEPDVSDWAQIGKREVAVLRSPSTAHVVGCGSPTTSKTNFSMPLAPCRMRGTLVAPCPNTTIALRLSFCATWSFGSMTASNQRVDGMPEVSMICLESKRDSIQS